MSFIVGFYPKDGQQVVEVCPGLEGMQLSLADASRVVRETCQCAAPREQHRRYAFPWGAVSRPEMMREVERLEGLRQTWIPDGRAARTAPEGDPKTDGVQEPLEPRRYYCGHDAKDEAVWGRCAHCGTAMHVHRSQLREAKREGYILERCPACHRPNAVKSTLRGEVWTAALDGAKPVQAGRLW